ncbi:hypothetical protein Tco_0668509 [Tanacetum coccineum]
MQNTSRKSTSNNNLRTSSNTKNKNMDTFPRIGNDRQTRMFGDQRTIIVTQNRETLGNQEVLHAADYNLRPFYDVEPLEKETDINKKDKKQSQNEQNRARNGKSMKKVKVKAKKSTKQSTKSKSKVKDEADTEEILNGPTRTHLMGRCMRTRSSSNLVGESSPNPTTSNLKRRNRRRSKQPFSLEESPVDTMADQRTMAELLPCTPPRVIKQLWFTTNSRRSLSSSSIVLH